MAIFFLTANHPVGEPKLEQSQIWKTCCEHNDCFVQQVQILTIDTSEATLLVDGYSTSVPSDRISPAPTSNWWVCYFDRNGDLTPKNIRCILYPDQMRLGARQP